MLAAGLLNHADDDGFFRANPGLIKAAVFPLREPSVSIHDMLQELCEIEYIRLYEGSDGKMYGHVVNFSEHQRINRKTDSKIKPLIDLTEDAVSYHDAFIEDSPPERKGKEQGKEENNAPSRYRFEGKVVRLTHEDFSRWEHSFPNLDIQAECQSYDDWAQSQPEAERNGWFHRLSGVLRKHNDEAKSKKPPKRNVPDHFDPNLYGMGVGSA